MAAGRSAFHLAVAPADEYEYCSSIEQVLDLRPGCPDRETCMEPDGAMRLLFIITLLALLFGSSGWFVEVIKQFFYS
uniref:Transposase n=1 Tax=Panagrellus redivivus TaxID=6233 RepID=A0A7E4VWS9_PANRE